MSRNPSFLRRVWNKLGGTPADIDACPEQMSESTRAWLLRRQARHDFSEATTYPYKVLTCHGRAIIPYRLTVSGYTMSSNLLEFMCQPRIAELVKQMQPLLLAPRGDILMLDEGTGRFYLKSALDKHGADKAPALGEIDMKTETMLFRHAAREVAMSRLFHGASRSNPIVLEEGTGKVYPKNNPADIRGHVRLGPSVHGPAAGKRRR